jgi:hypothetical protein
LYKTPSSARHQWLTHVILAEIRRIKVQSQPWQIVQETLSRKYLTQKKRAGEVAQVVGPEFKPQCHIKKKKR